jgi:glycosyltransferase involved in cell wall biosynthesis
MRVLMLSKACVVGIYQRKLEEIARLGVELRVLVPPSWRDERGDTWLERVYTSGYDLIETPIRLNGNFHLHYYPELPRHLADFRPDVIHVDEEPYNLATWHALWSARRHGAKTVAFSWQNIARHYPPPFRWGEGWALRQTDALIVGTESAAEVWRTKGYRGPLPVIPQFGTDPALFMPTPSIPARPFTIGYVGRLVEEKGIDLLLNAAAQLPGDWQVVIVGGGPERDSLAALAADLGISGRVHFEPQMPSTEMPSLYPRLDALVLPSRTRPNWKEQFGRVLVEAMSSGVPVVGSDSGAIPDVIGSGGLVFPEDDAAALTHHLSILQTDLSLRARLAAQGRQRVLDHFTHAQVAAATVRVYRDLLENPA